MSLNNNKFGDFVDAIYPEELEIKDTTDADNQASYLDLSLKFDSAHNLQVELYDKRDDFNFSIVNFHSFAAIYHNHQPMGYTYHN